MNKLPFSKSLVARSELPKAWWLFTLPPQIPEREKFSRPITDPEIRNSLIYETAFTDRIEEIYNPKPGVANEAKVTPNRKPNSLKRHIYIGLGALAFGAFTGWQLPGVINNIANGFSHMTNPAYTFGGLAPHQSQQKSDLEQ